MVENVLVYQSIAMDNVKLMLRMANGDIATTLTINSAEIQVPIIPLENDLTDGSCDDSTDDSTARDLSWAQSGRWLSVRQPSDHHLSPL